LFSCRQTRDLLLVLLAPITAACLPTQSCRRPTLLAKVVLALPARSVPPVPLRVVCSCTSPRLSSHACLRCLLDLPHACLDDALAEPPPGHAGRPAGLLVKIQKNLLYIYIKFYDFIVKYFYLMRIVRVSEIFWLRQCDDATMASMQCGVICVGWSPHLHLELNLFTYSMAWHHQARIT